MLTCLGSHSDSAMVQFDSTSCISRPISNHHKEEACDLWLKSLLALTACDSVTWLKSHQGRIYFVTLLAWVVLLYTVISAQRFVPYGFLESLVPGKNCFAWYFQIAIFLDPWNTLISSVSQGIHLPAPSVVFFCCEVYQVLIYTIG